LLAHFLQEPAWVATCYKWGLPLWDSHGHPQSWAGTGTLVGCACMSLSWVHKLVPELWKCIVQVVLTHMHTHTHAHTHTYTHTTHTLSLTHTHTQNLSHCPLLLCHKSVPQHWANPSLLSLVLTPNAQTSTNRSPPSFVCSPSTSSVLLIIHIKQLHATSFFSINLFRFL